MSSKEMVKVSSLRDHFLQLVSSQITGVEVFGDLENRLPNTLNIGFEGVEGDTLLIGLDMASYTELRDHETVLDVVSRLLHAEKNNI